MTSRSGMMPARPPGRRRATPGSSPGQPPGTRPRGPCEPGLGLGSPSPRPATFQGRPRLAVPGRPAIAGPAGRLRLGCPGQSSGRGHDTARAAPPRPTRTAWPSTMPCIAELRTLVESSGAGQRRPLRQGSVRDRPTSESRCLTCANATRPVSGAPPQLRVPPAGVDSRAGHAAGGDRCRSVSEYDNQTLAGGLRTLGARYDQGCRAPGAPVPTISTPVGRGSGEAGHREQAAMILRYGGDGGP